MSKPYSYYYSVKPILKNVTEQEFNDYLDNYPRELVKDVAAMCDPPLITYNDFELSDRWPHSTVASTRMWSDDPDDYYYTPLEERKFTIVANIEEVFASRTGNKTPDDC